MCIVPLKKLVRAIEVPTNFVQKNPILTALVKEPEKEERPSRQEVLLAFFITTQSFYPLHFGLSEIRDDHDPKGKSERHN